MNYIEAYGGMAALEAELEAALCQFFTPEKYTPSTDVFRLDVLDMYSAQNWPTTDQRVPNYFRNSHDSDRIVKLACYFQSAQPYDNRLFMFDERSNTLTMNTNHDQPLRSMALALLKQYLPPKTQFVEEAWGNRVTYSSPSPKYNLDGMVPPDLRPTEKAKILILSVLHVGRPLSGYTDIRRAISRHIEDYSYHAVKTPYKDNILPATNFNSSANYMVYKQAVRLLEPLLTAKRGKSDIDRKFEDVPPTVKSEWDMLVYFSDHGKRLLYDAADSVQTYRRFMVTKKKVGLMVKKKQLEQDLGDALIAKALGKDVKIATVVL